MRRLIVQGRIRKTVDKGRIRQSAVAVILLQQNTVVPNSQIRSRIYRIEINHLDEGIIDSVQLDDFVIGGGIRRTILINGLGKEKVEVVCCSNHFRYFGLTVDVGEIIDHRIPIVELKRTEVKSSNSIARFTFHGCKIAGHIKHIVIHHQMTHPITGRSLHQHFSCVPVENGDVKPHAVNDVIAVTNHLIHFKTCLICGDIVGQIGVATVGVNLNELIVLCTRLINAFEVVGCNDPSTLTVINRNVDIRYPGQTV